MKLESNVYLHGSALREAQEQIDAWIKIKQLPDFFSLTGLDHPCKEICSGWKQGYKSGQVSLQAKLGEVNVKDTNKN